MINLLLFPISITVPVRDHSPVFQREYLSSTVA